MESAYQPLPALRAGPVEWGARYSPICERCLRPRSKHSARLCRSCYERCIAINAMRLELRRPISQARMKLRTLSRALLRHGRKTTAIWRAKLQEIKLARRHNRDITCPHNILGASKFVSVKFAQSNELTPEDFVCQIGSVLDRLIQERGLTREAAMQIIADNL